MKIRRSELFDHIKSYESKDDFDGFLGFVDAPIRNVRCIRLPEGRIRVKYIDQENNIQRVDVGPGEDEEIEFP